MPDVFMMTKENADSEMCQQCAKCATKAAKGRDMQRLVAQRKRSTKGPNGPYEPLDHAKREIVASRFYEVPVEAIEEERSRGGYGEIRR